MVRFFEVIRLPRERRILNIRGFLFLKKKDIKRNKKNIQYSMIRTTMKKKKMMMKIIARMHG